MEDRVLDFFKTFADASRLRLAGLLLDEALSVEEIAARLKLRASDVPRHLAQLEKLGLLSVKDRRYAIDAKALETFSREVLAGRRPAVEARSNDENADEFDRKTVQNYSLPDGRLKEIPGQEKRLAAILRHVVQVFQPGVRYTEKEINQALQRFHPDTASLRRYLVDREMIRREVDGTSYWREPS
jgi:hypothetical protein